MRHPIQRQLLWPMLAVVMLGSAVTAVLSAWIGMRAVRKAEHERLKQLVATLTDAGFPCTDAVLKRMSELSGARFVTLDESGAVRHVRHVKRRIPHIKPFGMTVESDHRTGR